MCLLTLNEKEIEKARQGKTTTAPKYGGGEIYCRIKGRHNQSGHEQTELSYVGKEGGEGRGEQDEAARRPKGKGTCDQNGWIT